MADKFEFVPEDMNRWMDKVLDPGYHRYRPADIWRPAVNLYADQTHYCIVVDLAGVRADEIDLRVEDGVMILSGQREAPGMPDRSREKCVHLMEIDHGPFCRRVRLPADVNVDSIEASYRSGFLRIRIPKKT